MGERMISFTVLMNNIAKTPVLKHFDPDRPLMIVVYASKKAVSAALLQEHDGTYWPVPCTSRTLRPNEINYGIVEKEVLALLRILYIGYTMLVAREIKVLARHSTLARLVQFLGLNGRLGRWVVLLSNRTLVTKNCEKGEDKILGTLAASITPREEVGDMFSCDSLSKTAMMWPISRPTLTVEDVESLLVVSFDGSTRIKRKDGAYSAIIWKLPEWKIVTAAAEYAANLTLNEAEHRGLLLGFDLLAD